MPLQRLRDGLLGKHPNVDVVISQIGLLPNLAFASHTLRMTQRQLDHYGNVLSDCLRAVPGPRLDPAPLAQELLDVADWIDSQSWTDLPKVTSPIERVDANDEKHPLHRYSLSVSHHEANLFYSHEDTLDSTACAAYDQLISELSMFVIAAQSQIAPDIYLRYCKEWWRTDSLPKLPIYPEGRLASRVAGASRSARRLSRTAYRDLFDALATPTSTPLHQRVYEAEKSTWDEDSEKLLGALARLIQSTLPGWRRYRSSGSGGGGKKYSKKVRRPNFEDGFIRLPGKQSLSIEKELETENGVSYGDVMNLPTVVRDLIESALHEAEENDDANIDETLTKAERAIQKEARKREAQRRAEHELDGSKWIPADEAANGEAISFINLAADNSAEKKTRSQPGIRPASTSRYAADHKRRYLLAHQCTPDRLPHTYVLKFLSEMHKVDADDKNGPVLAALHAVIATGRSLDEMIHVELQYGHTPACPSNPAYIGYMPKRRRWVIWKEPPAWAGDSLTKAERRHAHLVTLPDSTGFFELLQHFNIVETPGQLIGKISKAREKSTNQWITNFWRSVGVDSGRSLLEHHLRHRLLAVSGGDLGLASIITGSDFAHGASVAHYAHYAPSRIQSYYRRAWSLEDTSQVKSRRARQYKARNIQRPGHGARRVPTIASVKTAIEGLREKIRASTGYDRHNAYTAYTWAGLLLGVAMRPVTMPIIYSPAFGAADGAILTFIEKARTDYHRRVNVIPPALTEHLQRYANYMRQWQPSKDWNQTERITLSWIDDGGDVREFRPSDFENLAASFFDLELYSLRRFMRTELARDESVSAEDIDAFMGHWFDGVSPVDRLSAYSFRAQQELAQGAVSNILKAVGFTPRWINQRQP